MLEIPLDQIAEPESHELRSKKAGEVVYKDVKNISDHQKRKVDEAFKELLSSNQPKKPKTKSQSLSAMMNQLNSKTKGKAKAKVISSISTTNKDEDKLEKAKEIASKITQELNKPKVEKEVRFAGRTIKITTNEKVSDNNSNSNSNSSSSKKKPDDLDLLINQLKAPKSISTLDKTANDWEQYKDKKGIRDEVEKAAKNGYLEKKDFLLRVDYRQFEKERDQREQERIKRELAAAKK